MRTLVTVVNIHSLSYTGTTWINLLLGGHDRAFALGPPDRVLTLLEHEPEKGSEACRIHAANCTFWPGFFEGYDTSGNFFVQLAAAANRDFIVLNNPVSGGLTEKHLQHPDIMIKDLYLVRDGRAVVVSYGRYHPEADYMDSVKDWFKPSAVSFPFNPSNPDALYPKYEDVATDPGGFLRNAGEFLGLTYPKHAPRFWEFDHHTTSGNNGTLSTIRRFNGQPFTGNDCEYREENYQRLMKEPDKTILDQRWVQELGERERLIFDWFCGEINERWGYQRDRFMTSRILEFQKDLGSEAKLRQVKPRRMGSTGRTLVRMLKLETLRAEGLHLSPREIKLMGMLAGLAFVISLLLVAIATALIF